MSAHVWLAALLIGATSFGCHHRGTRVLDTDGAVAADSLIGIVSVTGTSFDQRLVLRTGAGARALVAATAADSAALARLGGAELVVYGATAADHFAVTRFVVRSVDGAHVADGVLVRDGSRLLLRTRRGDLALGNPPSAFASLVGARLWVGGPLDSGPNVYGVITPVNK